MRKFFVILLLFISVFAAGCKEKSYIVFNRESITPENVLDGAYVFQPGERVYYLITLPKPVVTRQLYVQVFKRDNDEMRYGYKLIYGKTVHLKDEQQYYYTDYFVFNEKGLYEFKVYSKDEPTKELTSNIVQVR